MRKQTGCRFYRTTITGILSLLLSGLLLIGNVSVANEEDDLSFLGQLRLDPRSTPSLQRGARNFIYMCNGCHSAEFMRYSRMAQDIGITHDDGAIFEEVLTSNLMFTTDAVSEPMLSAMSSEDAVNWFGTPAPDLSLVARARSPEWLYHYLLGFYNDPTRPWGVNNLAFPDVGMPHVLVNLQGEQEPIYHVEQIVTADGDIEEHTTIVGLNLTKEGELSSEQYERFVTDIVNFLVYVGEPIKLERQRIGVYVILFLLVLLVVSYALKREYWKDIH